MFYLSLLDNIGGIKNISKINRIKIKKQQQINVKSQTRMGYFDNEDGWMLVRYWKSQCRSGRASGSPEGWTVHVFLPSTEGGRVSLHSLTI